MSRFANRVAIVVWLVVVWVALWGDLSAANVLSGLVVAVGVLTVFPVQRGRPWGLAVRPLALAQLVWFFLRTLVVSNLALARAVVSRDDRLHTGVIEVRLIWDSEVLMTVLTHLIGLSPGMTVIGVGRQPPRLYVHVLQLTDVDSARAEVLRLELLVLEAVGPAELVEAARAARQEVQV